jgi:hypothetical protein
MRSVALCDVDNRRAAEAYGKFPDLPKCENFRVMLDKQKDIDGLIVATPEFSRALIMAAAIKTGRHVFGETCSTTKPPKPPCTRNTARGGRCKSTRWELLHRHSDSGETWQGTGRTTRRR